MQLKIVKTVLNHSKTAGAVILLLALKLQKRENFSVISIMLLFTKSQLCHFTNQAQGDRRGSKVMNFTKKLILCNCIAINTKHKGFLMKLGIYINFRARIPNTKAIALNGLKDKYGYETTGLRY